MAKITEVRDSVFIPIIFLRVGSTKSISVMNISWEFNSSTNKPGCWFNGSYFMMTLRDALPTWSLTLY